MHHRSWIILMIAYLLLGYSCDTTSIKTEDLEDAESPKIAKAPVPSIRLDTARMQQFDKTYDVTGQIRAYQYLEVISEISGWLTTFTLRDGDEVTKGEIIATLDDRDQQLIISSLAVALQEKTFLRDEQRMLVSGNDFGQDSLLTEQQKENIDNKVGYNQAVQALDNAKDELRKYKIISPINGIVADQEAVQDQWVSAGSALCKIFNPKTYEAELFVLENVALQLQKGQNIAIAAIGDAKVTTHASIITINPIVDEKGLVKVRARLASRHNRFYHGMNIRASIKSPTPPTVVIPKKALVNRSNRDVVFTYDAPSGLAKWNYVTIGEANSTHVSITKGLEEGMAVIVEGNLNLAHDAKVQPTSSESTKE